jgi:hypothetical protein
MPLGKLDASSNENINMPPPPSIAVPNGSVPTTTPVCALKKKLDQKKY